MESEARLRRRVWHWLAPAVGLAALGLAAYGYFHTPRGRTYRLTMTGGSAASTRNEVAETMRRELASCGLDLEIRLCDGSEESLDLVNRGEVDCAFVQGGLGVGDRPDVRLVAMMQIEPLHLLVRKELAEKVTERLTALAGKTVNVDEPATGTHTLAVAVLAFAGLAPHADGKPGGYQAREFGLEKLITANASELPDAIFLCASLPSRVTTHLVTRHGYRLVPLPFGEAFALSSLGQQQAQPQGSHTIDKGRTYPVTIPAFTYGVEPPTPPRALPTLGNRLLVVAHKGVDPRPIERMIDGIYSSKFAHIMRPPLDARMMEMAPELPWHDGAEAYRRRNRPLFSGMVMDSAQKGVAILAAAASGLFVLWQWFKLRTQFLRDRGFSKYINKVAYIETAAAHVERDQIGGLALLHELREKLADLKSEALARFTEGELSGHELMAGFLVQANDVRDCIRDLIRRQEEAPAVGGDGRLPPLATTETPTREMT
jgi:TRAP-type uncharacterized transport system substrate-binding protein